jgi:hypothetical protein
MIEQLEKLTKENKELMAKLTEVSKILKKGNICSRCLGFTDCESCDKNKLLVILQSDAKEPIGEGKQ